MADTVSNTRSIFNCITLIDLLSQRAQQQPTRQAYTFLTDDKSHTTTVTYGDLDQQARTIAGHLQELGASGERVLLLHQPGLDYIAAFFGCLYAGCIAVPAYPPRFTPQDRTLPSLRSIVVDAQPVVALTTAAMVARAQATIANDPELAFMTWVATDTLASSTAYHWSPPTISEQELALLQYTSGSTAKPKGVMLSHSNLLHNQKLIHHSMQQTSESHMVSWLPPYHDMGLIGGILYPLYVGFPATLMAPVAFLQQPMRWLQAISRTRATISGAPNFAYDLCARKITPEQRASLDLGCWQVAFIGAEPIRAGTLEHFATTFASCGFHRQAFHSCYGLAEATLMVSGGCISSPPVLHVLKKAALQSHRVVFADRKERITETLVGCGLGEMPSQHLLIVDPHTRIPCRPDQIGEIWLAGLSVAQGYWNQPDATSQTFQAHLAEGGAGPYLRTGDLGYLHEGELVVTGRLKDLMIIRGHNYYPQDIEQTVERSHPALRAGCGAVFSILFANEERLFVVCEIDRLFRDQDVTDVFTAIRRAVSLQHGLLVASIVLLKTGSIPKTTSGKIQRAACKQMFQTGGFKAVTVGATGLMVTQDR